MQEAGRQTGSVCVWFCMTVGSLLWGFIGVSLYCPSLAWLAVWFSNCGRENKASSTSKMSLCLALSLSLSQSDPVISLSDRYVRLPFRLGNESTLSKPFMATCLLPNRLLQREKDLAATIPNLILLFTAFILIVYPSKCPFQ